MCPDGVNSIGETFQAGTHGVVVDENAAGKAQTAALYAGGFQNVEPAAPGRPLHMIADETIGHFAVAGGVVRDHGRQNDAVGKFERIDAYGGKYGRCHEYSSEESKIKA